MNIAVLITAPPYSQKSMEALLYCEEEIKKQHKILQIFFHSDGVYHSVDLYPPEDEPNPNLLFSELHKNHNIPLLACITAANRRGIREKNINKSFKLTGLGQWIESCTIADKVVQFG